MNASLPSRLVRAAAFLFGVGAWASWWYTLENGYPDRVPVLLWAAALFLFGASFFRPWQRTLPDVLTGAVVLLIGAAMLPRAVGLDLSPYEVTVDEAIHPLIGAEVLRDEPWRIFDGVSGHFSTPYLDFVLQGLLPNLQGARMMSAILSGLSLLTTYALASRLYDRKTGVFATIVLACSYWHVVYARTAYPFMQVILIPTLAFWPLVRGLQGNNNFLLFIGGIFLGLSGLLYTSGRIVVPIFAVWWLIGALVGWFRWRSILPVALGLVVLLSPYVYRNTVGIFFVRFLGTTSGEFLPLGAIESHGWFSDEAWRSVATQWKIASRVYLDAGAWVAPHSVSPAPMLDIVSLSLALGGLLLCVLGVWRSANALLLLWVGATFVGGQVLTDVPQSAYRAAPLLPALAIAAGVAVERIARMICYPFGHEGTRLRIFLGLALLAYLAPVNWGALEVFLYERTVDPLAAMARLVAAGDPRLAYFLVNSEPIVADPRFALIAGGKDARDVENLGDLLGANLADAVATRGGAIILLAPRMRSAESSIRRCYPGAIALGWPQWRGLQPTMGFWLQRNAIEPGRNCDLRSNDERGLRATYYEDQDFKGPVVHSRFEDWTLRWFGDNGPTDYGSIEWRGFLNVPVPGMYTLSLAGVPDGASAEFSDKIFLKGGQKQIALLAARIYPVRLRYRAEPQTRFSLVWQPPGGEAEVIPPELFSPYPRNRSDLRWVE